MKRITSILTAILFLSANAFALDAENLKEGNKKKKVHTQPKSAEDCSPATARAFLDFNNVKALIENGGSMWQDRANNAASYEVPNGSGQTSIYSGSLWMGGLDANGNLKIAAVTFRNGDDFWPGPLTTDGQAFIDQQTCTDYDKFYGIKRSDVELFIAYTNCIKNGIGCDVIPAGYEIPKNILEWPAHGDLSKGQDFYLAPFKDVNENGVYEPEEGDYPYYDLFGEIDCRVVRDVRLFGDTTVWWVFNDKGNTHTETNGQPIGMEVRAQAFAFATNDEVNNMTFANYELINRSTFELTNTYFAQWADPDIGNPDDDYAGCDVMRGLGYVYNGDNDDQDNRGILGYGDRPPAVGIDFFEGPYQDNNGVNDNYGIGTDEALNGIGYYNPDDLEPDTIIDNERFGMRRYVYYNRGGGPFGDPNTALQHYNLMRSIWKDGSKMVYGGRGTITDPNATSIEADFMFPGESDPLNWGTRGVDPGFVWDEIQAGNPPFDRRFLQSAGPFTLQPGAVNDITVGVVWAQAISGGNWASVLEMFRADTKAQALFDNCFELLDGPDAPDLSGKELENEIILYLTNPKGLSNNYKEYPGDYEEIDPFIVLPEDATGDNVYRFQGYQIYQVTGVDVRPSDIGNFEKARLVFQCDIQDDVTDLINYEFDEELGGSVPSYKVRGAANEGIFSTFRVTEDLFAESGSKLVNFKTYYFMAVAYAHNNYKDYREEAGYLDGQKIPYLQSRKGVNGDVRPVGFTPHPQDPKYGGTTLNAAYGDQPEITRIDGRGNGGFYLRLKPESEAEILEQNSATKVLPTYEPGFGPVDIKVIDPTNVYGGEYHLQVYDEDGGDLANANWKIWRTGEVGSNDPIDLNDTVFSEADVSKDNEQIIDKWGISVNLRNALDPGDRTCVTEGDDPTYRVGFIGSNVLYTDSSKAWLSGVPDVSGQSDQNWIRTGTQYTVPPGDPNASRDPAWIYDARITSCDVDGSSNEYLLDQFNVYDKLAGGYWTPGQFAALSFVDPTTGNAVAHAPLPKDLETLEIPRRRIQDVPDVDIVFTNNQDLWTRCPVIETQDELIKTQIDPDANFTDPGLGTIKNMLRQSPSVGKDGKPDGTGYGMGWFPGYAINVNTGERMQMAFGEDSWLGDHNGADMMWNPTSTLESGFDPADNGERDKKWGGKHYVYVFNNADYMDNTLSIQKDGGINEYTGDATYLAERLDPNNYSVADFPKTWTNCAWVGMPMLEPGRLLMESDVRIELRVNKSYRELEHEVPDEELANNGLPYYTFDMDELGTSKNRTSTAESALDMITVVPNPYYAFAEHYERTQTDNEVRIVNLPEVCKVRVYNTNGTLIRAWDKSDPTTYIRWNLKNQESVPIAGGLYLVYIDVPGVGEKVVKWFGVLRPVDLQGF